jgi:hypothetical protein
MYLTVFHMIGLLKRNKRLNDMTPKRMPLDVSVSLKKIEK